MSERFKWTRSKSGRWSSNGYVIERKDAGRQWRLVRNGVFWDLQWRLTDAKRSCENDFARRQAMPPRLAVPVVAAPEPPDPKPFLQVFIASSISEAILAERHRIASRLRALLGQVGGGSDKVMRLVAEAVEGNDA